MWVGLTSLDRDPHPEVAQMSRNVTEYIRLKVTTLSTNSVFHLLVDWSGCCRCRPGISWWPLEKLPSRLIDPTLTRLPVMNPLTIISRFSWRKCLVNKCHWSVRDGKPNYRGAESPPRTTHLRSAPGSHSRIRKRSIPTTVSLRYSVWWHVDHNRNICCQIAEEGDKAAKDVMKDPLVRTEFVEWCARHLAEPTAKSSTSADSPVPLPLSTVVVPAAQEEDLTIEFEVSFPSINVGVRRNGEDWILFLLCRSAEGHESGIQSCTTRASGVTPATLPSGAKRRWSV